MRWIRECSLPALLEEPVEAQSGCGVNPAARSRKIRRSAADPSGWGRGAGAV